MNAKQAKRIRRAARHAIARHHTSQRGFFGRLRWLFFGS
jgi:hypothetical protein